MKIEDYPKFTIIMRGYSFEEDRAILSAMKGLEKQFAGEVTMNTPGAAGTIKRLNDEFGKKLIIGAGTVLSFEDEIEAIDAGAKFALSACTFTKPMIEYAKKRGVITVPGMMTPSEVLQQLRYGADIIKIFPATTVGPKYFKDIQGPLNHIRLMAVGGISKNNVHQFFENGADYAGIGSGAFNKEDIQKKNINNLHESLLELIKEA